MLADSATKVKIFLRENRNDLLLASLVFFVGAASFGLGRLSAVWPEKEPLRIENDETRMTNEGKSNPPDSAFGIGHSSFAPAGQYVASRNGSSYHLPSCPGALQIKDENKVWFQTRGEAERAGYKPAGNCPGL